MKEVIIEKIEKVVKYEAIDGKIFTTKEECKKYDDTAFAVINAEYKKLVKKETTEETLFNLGSYDSFIDIVEIKNIEDLQTILKMVAFFYKDNDAINRAKDLCEKCLLKNDDKLLIYRGYDEEDNFWIISTFYLYIEELKNKVYGNIC